MKVGDLVRMKTHETGLIGIVVGRDRPTSPAQISIQWFGSSGKVQREPENWLEVISECR